MNNTYIDFAPDFDKLVNVLGYDISYTGDEKYELEEQPDVYEFLEDFDQFVYFLNKDKESLIKYLEQYYGIANELYRYFEYEYPRFGGREYLSSLSQPQLYLCSKYFKSIGDKQKERISTLLMLCSCVYYGIFPNEGTLMEDQFENVKDLLGGDWLALHPQITFQLGRYFNWKGEYERAKEWFELGSKIDYEGRQSIEPFVEVGRNQYELGQMYLTGTGVTKDIDEAYRLFDLASSNAGQRSIPAIGDMYYEGLLEDEASTSELLEMYLGRNMYNAHLYIEYTFLTDVQKERVDELINKYLNNEDLTVNGLLRLARLYNNNYGKKDDVFKSIALKTCNLISTIPEDKRNKEMKDFFQTFKDNK